MPMLLSPPPQGFGWSWMPAVLKQLAHSFLNLWGELVLHEI